MLTNSRGKYSKTGDMFMREEFRHRYSKIWLLQEEILQPFIGIKNKWRACLLPAPHEPVGTIRLK